MATIFTFMIYVGTYYFSNENKKKSYRSFELFDNSISDFSKDLKILESDTDNITEYIEGSLIIQKKKYKFCELIFEK